MAACGSSSKFDFYCGFFVQFATRYITINEKRKHEFAHDVITEFLKALLHKFPMYKAADVIACFSL